MNSHLYPNNSQWSGVVLGAECTDGDRIDYDVITRFTHTDGRLINADISVALGGEVLVNREQRDPRWLDGFATTVDEAYEQLCTDHLPKALARNFWVYDTTVAHNAAPSEAQLNTENEIREESTDLVNIIDLDYHGAFAGLPKELVIDRLTLAGNSFVTGTLCFNDMEAMYAKLTMPHTN